MLLTLLFNNYLQKEKFSNDIDNTDGIKSLYLYMIGYNSNYYYIYGVTDYIFLAVFYLLAFIISAWCAYISFNCTWKGSVTNIYVRLFTALFAFLLGPVYLVWYLLINYIGKLC